MGRGVVLAVTLGVLAPESAFAGAWPDLDDAAPRVGGGGKDAALVVAVEDYAFLPSVPGAVRNGEAWVDWLVRTRAVPASRVVFLANDDAVRETLEDKARRLASLVGKGGTFWFVFVGHGAPSSKAGDGLLLGYDVMRKASSLESRGFPRSGLLASLSASRSAERVVAVLDTCFSGLTFEGDPLVRGLQPVLLTDLAKPKDRRLVVLSAGRGDQVAGPLPGEDRPAFSYLVLGGLRGWADADGDRHVTAGEVLAYTSGALRVGVHDRRQDPELAGPEDARLAVSAKEPAPDLAAAASGGAARAAPPRPSRSSPAPVSARDTYDPPSPRRSYDSALAFGATARGLPGGSYHSLDARFRFEREHEIFVDWSPAGAIALECGRWSGFAAGYTRVHRSDHVVRPFWGGVFGSVTSASPADCTLSYGDPIDASFFGAVGGVRLEIAAFLSLQLEAVFAFQTGDPPVLGAAGAGLHLAIPL